jgi:uncharacterized membrane protein YkvA (DUF1232 family)
LARAAAASMLGAMSTTGTESTRSPRARAFEFLVHLPNLVRLYWRLVRDPRVSMWPKALLVGALVYVVLPFDLIPDALPLIGQIDDLVIVAIAAQWFIRWCPVEVVREHAAAIGGRSPL